MANNSLNPKDKLVVRYVSVFKGIIDHASVIRTVIFLVLKLSPIIINQLSAKLKRHAWEFPYQTQSCLSMFLLASHDDSLFSYSI